MKIGHIDNAAAAAAAATPNERKAGGDATPATAREPSA